MMDDKKALKDADKFIDGCSCPECGFDDELGIDEVSCDQKKCKKCGAMMMTSLKQQNEELMASVRGADSIADKFKILVEASELDSKEPGVADDDDAKKKKKAKAKKGKGEKDDKDGNSEKDENKVQGDGAEETNEGRLFNRLDEGDELNKKIDHKSKYHCEKCGIVVSAAIYEDECVCPKCGDDFAILEDKDFLDNERRFICPQCSSSYRYTKINEDSCNFCQSLMTVFDKPEIRKSKTAISTE